MRAKKWLTFITFGCSILALIVAIAVGKNPTNIVYDIAMAVFGSALLGFIMSLIEYIVERRHAMETFWDEGRDALSKLRSIKYIDMNAPSDLVMACFQEEWGNTFAKVLDPSKEDKAKEKLISWFEENIPMNWTEDDDISAELDRYYSSQMESYRKSILKCIESCVAIASVDHGALGNAYGNLDFMFANACVRKPAFEKIYNKILEYRNLVKEEEYHFRQLINGQGNFPVCAKKAYGIVQKVFTEKLDRRDGFESKVVYQSAFDDIDDALEDFRCKIYRHVEPDYPKHIPVLGSTTFFDFDDEDKDPQTHCSEVK